MHNIVFVKMKIDDFNLSRSSHVFKSRNQPFLPSGDRPAGIRVGGNNAPIKYLLSDSAKHSGNQRAALTIEEKRFSDRRSIINIRETALRKEIDVNFFNLTSKYNTVFSYFNSEEDFKDFERRRNPIKISIVRGARTLSQEINRDYKIDKLPDFEEIYCIPVNIHSKLTAFKVDVYLVSARLISRIYGISAPEGNLTYNGAYKQAEETLRIFHQYHPDLLPAVISSLKRQNLEIPKILKFFI